MENLGLPRAECPEQIGLSSARLKQITAMIGADVERGLVPGAVLLIARGGRIGYAEALGWRDREAQTPMSMDAIFRIASMTKPLTSVAAMILAEEGRLGLRLRPQRNRIQIDFATVRRLMPRLRSL